MAIRVLPTVYAGKRFRSRLEAKWAFFFDQLQIAWEYEPDGFQLQDGTRYLPDFYLPKFSRGVYVEIKPEGDPFLKARKFALEAPRPIWLCDGEPRWRAWTVLHTERLADDDGKVTSAAVEEYGIPCYLRGVEEQRFWWLWGEELEDEATGRWQAPELFAALDALRIHRFWEPEVRP